MKVKKIIKKPRNRILDFKILKTKNFSKTLSTNNFYIKKETFRLKQIYYLIYKYHACGKNILFVTPRDIIANLKTTKIFKKHMLIPEFIWYSGVISNRFTLLKTQQKNKRILKIISNILNKIKKNIDLIVIHEKPNNKIIRHELYKTLAVPVISINSNLSIKNSQTDYKIPGNFKQNHYDYFYSFLIPVIQTRNSNFKHSKLKPLKKKFKHI